MTSAKTQTIDGFTYTITGDAFGALPASAYVVCEYLTAGCPSHVHKGPTPVLRSFLMFSDGSGCVATVNVYGRIMSCEYRSGEFRVSYHPPKRDKTPKWKIQGSIDAARAAFIARFNEVVPDGWRESHAALYA